MNKTHQAVLAIRRHPVFPVLSQERLFATEHVAAKLDLRSGTRTLSVLALALSPDGVETLTAGELRRALDEAWSGILPRSVSAALLASAMAKKRRSSDRAIVEAYFMRYPVSHADFGLLREAARTAAERHDWRWRTAGRRYGLWEPDAAARCAAMHQPPSPAFFREIGLVGQLAHGSFASALHRPASGS